MTNRIMRLSAFFTETTEILMGSAGKIQQTISQTKVPRRQTTPLWRKVPQFFSETSAICATSMNVLAMHISKRTASVHRGRNQEVAAPSEPRQLRRNYSLTNSVKFSEEIREALQNSFARLHTRVSEQQKVRLSLTTFTFT